MGRSIERIVDTPPPEPGFIGHGHTAVSVVRPDSLGESDPFVLLMDDRLDIEKRRRIGGAHPHANIETVTLLLEGSIWDRDEGQLRAGDVLWMTAGRGIIHNEAVEAEGRSRILQLWVALPQRDRELAPQFELIRRETAPVFRTNGVEARLYSGTSAGLRSTTRNRVPITMVDVSLDAGARFEQALPASYNGFVYVIDGAAHIGCALVAKGRVGWLDRPRGAGDAPLEIEADEGGARLVLYAGEPLNEPLLQYGPFVGATQLEIADLFRRYRTGSFEKMSRLARRRSEKRLYP